ncbi:hypothetical protein D038_1226B, partial [Vibrio parahaemolyticus IDH02189]
RPIRPAAPAIAIRTIALSLLLWITRLLVLFRFAESF